MREIKALELEKLIDGEKELALLDLREEGAQVSGRLFRASAAPLWRLETIMAALVPNKGAPVVLTDLDGSDTLEGAAKLERLGYSNVSVLNGGLEGWKSEGLEVFTDQNVHSKAFGEVVEKERATPSISAKELRGRLQENDDLVVLDGRTREEFLNFSIPGALSVPNAELPYRIGGLLKSPKTKVVVNCAGRTRSIIGAQGLIDSGLENPVASLENGTQGWLLEGYELERGPSPSKLARASLPEPGEGDLKAPRAALSSILSRLPVNFAGEREIEAFRGDKSRTTYFFDPRTIEEHEAGRPLGFAHAPGGQLIQATDRYIGVRRARIVILDCDGVRGPWTAMWLAQAGAGEVWLHRPPQGGPLAAGPDPRILLADPLAPPPRWISPLEASKLSGARIFDIENSVANFKRRISGALFAAPNRLKEILKKGGPEAILASSDGALAGRAAASLSLKSFSALAILGGTKGWESSGLPLDSGPGGEVLTGHEDVRYAGWESYLGVVDEPAEARNEKFRSYLAWERNLINQAGRRGAKVEFKLARGLDPR
jgi:rhodanese-related sulfurtransferase